MRTSTRRQFLGQTAGLAALAALPAAAAATPSEPLRVVRRFAWTLPDIRPLPDHEPGVLFGPGAWTGAACAVYLNRKDRLVGLQFRPAGRLSRWYFQRELEAEKPYLDLTTGELLQRRELGRRDSEHAGAYLQMLCDDQRRLLSLSYFELMSREDFERASRWLPGTRLGGDCFLSIWPRVNPNSFRTLYLTDREAYLTDREALRAHFCLPFRPGSST